MTSAEFHEAAETPTVEELVEEFTENGLDDVADYLAEYGVVMTRHYLAREIKRSRANDDPEGWRLGNLEVAKDRLVSRSADDVARMAAAPYSREMIEDDFDAALHTFKIAAMQLSEAWSAERDGEVPQVTDYPAYLPSFDEFALEVQNIQRAS